MPRVARFDVLRQVEVRGVQTGFSVASESGGQSGVARLVDVVLDGVGEVVGPVWDRARCGKVGDWRCVGFPDVAGGVEDWKLSVGWSGELIGLYERLTSRYYEEEEGDGVVEVCHGLGG